MIATLGDHHRVKNHWTPCILLQTIGNYFGNRRIAHHANLDGIDPHVVKYSVDLAAYKRWTKRYVVAYTASVLRYDSSNNAHAVSAKCREGLQIGLDASSAGGIGTGDTEYIGYHVVAPSPQEVTRVAACRAISATPELIPGSADISLFNGNQHASNASSPARGSPESQRHANPTRTKC